MTDNNTAMVKLALARESIRKNKIKKIGHNKYSDYDYFTPEQVGDMVATVSQEFGLLPVFNLVRDEHGKPVGRLDVYNVEDGQFVTFQQITDIPQITATNIAQQMGGMATYSERYLSMTAFGIKDNSLDFDSQDNTKKTSKKVPPKKKEEEKPIIDVGNERLEKMKEFLGKGGKIDLIKKEVSLTKAAEKELNDYLETVKK